MTYHFVNELGFLTYTKDHIITCDRCTFGKFYSFVRWITWWQVTTDEDAWRPLIRYGITSIYIFYGFVVIFYLVHTLEYMKLVNLPAFKGGSCISKKTENADDNQVRVYDEKWWACGLFSKHYKPSKLSSME